MQARRISYLFLIILLLGGLAACQSASQGAGQAAADTAQAADNSANITPNSANITPGYFAAADLPRIIEQAANGLQRGSSLRSMLSPVLVSDKRAQIDFSPPVYPKGMSFSLENLNSAQRSDTLAFSLRLTREAQSPQTDLVMFCVALVLEASSPGMTRQPKEEIDAIIAKGGAAALNGWEYVCTYDEESDPMLFTFSARKLPHRTEFGTDSGSIVD